MRTARADAGYLIELIKQSRCTFFHTPRKDAKVSYCMNDHFENSAVRSKDFKLYCKQELFESGKTISDKQLQEALDHFESNALFRGERIEQSIRTAWANDAVLIDLCNGSREVVKVTQSEWEVLDSSMVRYCFERHPAMKESPRPERNGTLDDLRSLIGIRNEITLNLLLIWTITCFIPGLQRPGINISGDQGSGKSLLAKRLKELTDPSEVPLCSLPDNQRELALLLSKNHILVLDNISGKFPKWASDTLCQTITGGSFVTRKLYTNSEEVVLKMISTFILNGINSPATAPDLLDRSLLILMKRLKPEQRKTVRELEETFKTLHPKAFGAILDVLSKTMSLIGKIDLKEYPRMADWARWGYAVAEASGIGGERFLNAYKLNRNQQHSEVIESDALAHTVFQFAKSHKHWEGTPTDLYSELTKFAQENSLHSKSWPGASQVMTRKLNELEHTLSQLGVEYSSSKRGKGRACSLNYEGDALKN